MGGAVCIGQPQQKVMKLKAQGGNTEGMQVINNFDYEEFAFEREGDNNNNNNEPSKVKAAGGNPNRNNNVNDDNNNEGKDKDEGNNNNRDKKDGGVGEGKNGDGGEMKKDEDGQGKDKEGDKSGEGVQQQQQQQQQQPQQATEEEYQMEFRAQTKTKAKRANENEHNNEDGRINNNNANTNANANVNNQAVPSNVVDNKQQQQPPQHTEVKNNNNNNNSQPQNKTNVNNPPAVDNTNNNNNNENKEIDTTTKKSFYKQSRKNQFPDIYSVIPEKLLTSCDGNELLFISDLKKMININAKERVKYSDRFCMVTKDNFILYNSKENYITLKRPLAILPINQITRVVLFKLNPLGIGYDHFYICFDKNSTTEIIYQQINTFFMNGGATIAEEGVEGEEKKEISPPKENEVLLMFKSENSELIKKWYVVLNYLIGIAKGKSGNKEKEEQQKEGVQQG